METYTSSRIAIALVPALEQGMLCGRNTWAQNTSEHACSCGIAAGT
jgi:hypothetical protein